MQPFFDTLSQAFEGSSFDTLAEAHENLCYQGCGNSIPNSATICDDCAEAGMWDENRAYEYGE